MVVARKPSKPAPPTAAEQLAAEQLKLTELARDWLEAKQVVASDRQLQKGHSDRARRGDLCRIGRLITIARGRAIVDWATPLDLDADLGACTLDDFTTEHLVRAITAARKSHFSSATVRRVLSTLRGFTRWLNARGHLRVDPCADVDELLLPARAVGQPKALMPSEVDALVATAAAPPPARSRHWWPVRDVAIVHVLARCGLRADEVVDAQVGWIDRSTRVPVFRVVGKGDKARTVPIPRVALAAVDAYLEARVPLLGTPKAADPLFVRSTGEAISYQVLDGLVRGLASRAGVQLPAGAAAHAFRHFYGTQLALAKVNTMALAELLGHADPKTTKIYTDFAADQLIDVVEEAGWL